MCDKGCVRSSRVAARSGARTRRAAAERSEALDQHKRRTRQLPVRSAWSANQLPVSLVERPTHYECNLVAPRQSRVVLEPRCDQVGWSHRLASVRTRLQWSADWLRTDRQPGNSPAHASIIVRWCGRVSTLARKWCRFSAGVRGRATSPAGGPRRCASGGHCGTLRRWTSGIPPCHVR
jgi:hypothetical protein